MPAACPVSAVVQQLSSTWCPIPREPVPNVHAPKNKVHEWIHGMHMQQCSHGSAGKARCLQPCSAGCPHAGRPAKQTQGRCPPAGLWSGARKKVKGKRLVVWPSKAPRLFAAAGGSMPTRPPIERVVLHHHLAQARQPHVARHVLARALQRALPRQALRNHNAGERGRAARAGGARVVSSAAAGGSYVEGAPPVAWRVGLHAHTQANNQQCSSASVRLTGSREGIQVYVFWLCLNAAR